MTRTLALALALAAAPALAQPIEFVVDETQSSIFLEIEIVSPLGTRTDSDTAATGGTALVAFDSNAAPTSLELVDYSFVTTESIDLFYNYTPFGTLTIEGVGVGITLPAGFPAELAAVDPVTGAFGLPEIDTQVIGAVNVTSTGLLAGTVGSQSFDLATDTAPDTFAATGTVTVVGSDITIAIEVPFQTTQQDATGVTFNVVGTASVVLTAAAPCTADTNGDGVLTPADFNGWILAFNNAAPACDQNGDGLCTPSDFNAWILNFNTGC